MPLINYIFILVFAFQALGCGSSASKNNTLRDAYIPLAAGNRWEYVKEGTDSAAYNVEVLNVKQESGDVTAEFNMLPYFFLSENKQMLAVKADGEMIIITEDRQKTNFFPPARDLKKGYTWSAGAWHSNIAGLEETVTAGGKTYTNCVYLSYSLSITFVAEMWISPGTGIVKWGFNRTNPPSPKFDYYILKNHKLN